MKLKETRILDAEGARCACIANATTAPAAIVKNMTAF